MDKVRLETKALDEPPAKVELSHTEVMAIVACLIRTDENENNPLVSQILAKLREADSFEVIYKKGKRYYRKGGEEWIE